MMSCTCTRTIGVELLAELPAVRVLQTSEPLAAEEPLYCNTIFPFHHLTIGANMRPSGKAHFNAERGQSVGD